MWNWNFIFAAIAGWMIFPPSAFATERNPGWMFGSPAVATNRPPLLAAAFTALPLGSVMPRGWLLKQCELQRDGLTGNAEALYAADLGTNSAWLGGSGEAWERGPYYLKGLVALAYTLDDPVLKQKAQKWIDWILENQAADGSIGPKSNNDWWPRMLATHALRDYYEATGDPRATVVLGRYFRYMFAALPSRPLSEWGKARAGDEMDVAIWLYNRTGDAYLLGLVELLRKQAYDWMDIFSSNNFTGFGTDFQPKHNVNIEQALKFPAVYYQLSGKAADRDSLKKGLENLMRENALSFGINSGTEFLSGCSSVQGVELCSIVEAMLSLETCEAITGDPAMGDRLEKITFNALPAALANDIKALQYYTLPNNVIAIKGWHGFNQDYDNGTVPGPDSGYPCCRCNMHMGWPKYIQNSWAGTTDGGLCAMAYGPVEVTLRKGGSEVRLEEETDYPFEEQIRLKISLKDAANFPLVLRIPAWCAHPSVFVNEEGLDGIVPGSFYRIERTWKKGDVVRLNFPMSVQTQTGPEKSVAISRGPLVYSLKIDEEWKPRSHHPAIPGFDEFELHAKSPWNFALELDPSDAGASFVFTNSGKARNPFDPSEPSVALLAKARLLPGWTIGWRGTHAFEPPVSPVTSESLLQQVRLVPFGSQHLRISWFPYLGKPALSTGEFSENFDSEWCARWTTFGGNWMAGDGSLNTVPASAHGAKALAMGTSFTNFTYEADVSVGKSGNAGVIFRATKPDIGDNAYCGYYAGINAGDGKLEFGCASNAYRELASAKHQFSPNTKYRLKVVAEGSRLQVFVSDDKRPLVDIFDDRYDHGMVGVRDFCPDDKQSISGFASLKVREFVRGEKSELLHK